MNIDGLNTQFAKLQTIGEVTSELDRIFRKLDAALQQQPNFRVLTDPNAPVPESDPTGTVIFQLNASNVVRIGIYNQKTRTVYFNA